MSMKQSHFKDSPNRPGTIEIMMDIHAHVRCTCTLYIVGLPCLKLFIGCGTAHRRVKVGYVFVVPMKQPFIYQGVN